MVNNPQITPYFRLRKPRLSRFLEGIHQSWVDLYNQIEKYEDGYTLSQADGNFIKKYQDNIEYLKYLTSDLVKAYIVRRIEIIFKNIGSGYSFINVLYALFGEGITVNSYVNVGGYITTEVSDFSGISGVYLATEFNQQINTEAGQAILSDYLSIFLEKPETINYFLRFFLVEGAVIDFKIII